MTQLPTSLPPERDLAPERHSALRAELMRQATSSRRQLPRGLAPVAAAVALAVVITTTFALVGADHSGSGQRSGGGSQSGPHIVPADATVAERCLSGPGGTVDVIFVDNEGYYAAVEKAGKRLTCAFDWASHVWPGLTAGIIPAASTYAPAKGSHVFVAESESLGVPSAGQPSPRRTAFRGSDGKIHTVGPNEAAGYGAFGTVARDVTRVVLTWPGRGSVEAAIRGPYFIGRLLNDSLSAPTTFTVTTYDATGHLLGTVNQP